jgi:hypothetical protein
MHPLILIAVFIVALLVLLIAVAFLEKRMAWPYSDFAEGTGFDDAYGNRMVEEAHQLGFIFLHWCHDLKGEVIRVNYAMLVSPNRDSIAVIGAGTVLSMKVQCTWIHTPTSDGRSFYSTDHQNGIENDISGMWKNQLVSTRDFEGLWEKHKEWTERLQISPLTFKPEHELAEFRKVREEHFHLMVKKGLIRYTDSTCSHWRYTIFGAIKVATRNYAIGLSRALTFGKFPRQA